MREVESITGNMIESEPWIFGARPRTRLGQQGKNEGGGLVNICESGRLKTLGSCACPYVPFFCSEADHQGT